MIRFQMLIWWSEPDDSFVVDVLELPGCMADGRTYEEAVATPEWSWANGSRPPDPSGAPYPNLGAG